MTLHEFCIKNNIGQIIEEEIYLHLSMTENQADGLPEQTYLHAYASVIQSHTSNWLK